MQCKNMNKMQFSGYKNVKFAMICFQIEIDSNLSLNAPIMEK